jgi:prepilin-type N-terminal cleavage/methylation domain-containing protein
MKIVARRAVTGFTLVELLVAVAILALLIAVVTIASLSLQKMAWRAEAASNLRAIGKGIALFFGGHVAPVESNQLAKPE